MSAGPTLILLLLPLSLLLPLLVLRWLLLLLLLLRLSPICHLLVLSKGTGRVCGRQLGGAQRVAIGEEVVWIADGKVALIGGEVGEFLGGGCSVSEESGGKKEAERKEIHSDNAAEHDDNYGYNGSDLKQINLSQRS